MSFGNLGVQRTTIAIERMSKRSGDIKVSGGSEIKVSCLCSSLSATLRDHLSTDSSQLPDTIFLIQAKCHDTLLVVAIRHVANDFCTLP
jgi:hypothetical protein